MKPKTIRSLDFLIPVKTVSDSNLREHWVIRNRRKKLQQIETLCAMATALHRRTIELPCAITLTRVAPRKLDAHDNLPRSFKGIVDQLCKVLGCDDGDTSKVRFEYDQKPAGPKVYAVKVSIRPLISEYEAKLAEIS